MSHVRLRVTAAVVVFLSLPAAVALGQASDDDVDITPPPPPRSSSRPQASVRFSLDTGSGAATSADLDRGGDFDVSRWSITPRVSWNVNPDLSLAFSIGYERASYDFGGVGPLASLDPWEDVDTLSLGFSARWKIDDAWTGFVGPSLRMSAETDADLADGLSGGVIAGAAYRVNDRLSIGPGLGVYSRIEDDVSVFPIVVLDWKITDTLSLRTGGGGASAGAGGSGAGVTLAWAFAPEWELSFAARYQQRRFRLDDRGVAPDGVGEETSIPLVAALTWRFTGSTSLTFAAGVAVAGELTLEDDRGDRIARDDYDPSPFFGLSLGVRF